MRENNFSAESNSTGATRYLTWALIALATIGIAYLRRPDQILHPYVWDEDGTYILAHFVTDGWPSFFSPVAGYLILPSKAISLISHAISFAYYPEISTALTLAATTAVCGAIATAPTDLRYRTACGLSILLLPHNPEPLAIPLYIFWWTSLLSVLALLWKDETQNTFLRLAFITIGGMSSPLIIALVPAFFIRMWAKNWERQEIMAFSAAMIAAAIQLYFLTTSQHVGARISLPPATLPLIIEKFFGYYIAYRSGHALIIGLALMAYLIHACLKMRTVTHLLMLYILATTVAISVARAPIDLIDPLIAGPRYFFFPYCLITWVLISSTRTPLTAIIATVLLSTAFYNGLMNTWARGHDTLDWRQEISTCSQRSRYEIPVHYDGNEAATWPVSMRGEDCLKMLRRSLLDKHISLPPPLPVTFKGTTTYDAINSQTHIQVVQASGWRQGAAYPLAMLRSVNDSDYYGSRVSDDSNTGNITLSASGKTISLYYTTGPVAARQFIQVATPQGVRKFHLKKSPDHWSRLELDESLGHDIIITLSDEGDDWGEWSAVLTNPPGHSSRATH